MRRRLKRFYEDKLKEMASQHEEIIKQKDRKFKITVGILVVVVIASFIIHVI